LCQEQRGAFCGRNVDDVHNLMDDVAEQQDIANEISDAISNPVGFQQDVDEVSFRKPHSVAYVVAFISESVTVLEYLVFSLLLWY